MIFNTVIAGGGSSELNYNYYWYSLNAADETITFDRPLKAFFVIPYYSRTTSSGVYYYQGGNVILPQDGIFLDWSGSSSQNPTPTATNYDFAGIKYYFSWGNSAITSLYTTAGTSSFEGALMIASDFKAITFYGSSGASSSNSYRFVFVY